MVGKRLERPKLTSCSPSDVVRALRKLGGFIVKEGAKHIKVIHIGTGKSSTIPRHAKVNRYLLRDFVDDYLVRDVGLNEKEIYKHLWC
ncbi:MAG: type II toxin-antitoxin system HicA family toxin [Candidatus Taylorbacteria bacterium]|nr:type II toxin-antitoxin system HicA family toxin [Candidatus Taylorbacteria bacterium]